MVRRLSAVISTVWLLALAGTALAQAPNPTQLTLDRIFLSGELHGEHFGPAQWMDDGAAYTVLEDSAAEKGSHDIVRYDARSGRRQVLIAATQLRPEDAKAPLRVESYALSNENRLLLIFTNSKRVWHQNNAGDYWVLDRQNKKLRKLGGAAAGSSLSFAKLSPDGTRAGYVRDHNIYVEDLRDGTLTRLTNDGSDNITNGSFDWVYEEEFEIRDGWRWSPDSSSIAYWQINTEGVPLMTLIDDTDSLYPTIKRFAYPKTGERNPSARVGVVRLADSKTTWMDVPGEPCDHYLARMDWAASSDEIVLQQLNRLQNTNKVMLGSAASGKTRTVLVEHDSAWIDVQDQGLLWFKDGKAFTWISERDGWRHVYIVDREGGKVRQLTHGAFDVIQIDRLDEKAGWLYFTASPENATQKYLYRISWDTTAPAKRLTPAAQPGTHDYEIAPGGRFAIHTYSTFRTPPKTDLIRLESHDVLRPLVKNEHLQTVLENLKLGSTEFFRLPGASGIPLDGWLMKPPHFDPSKRYPLLFYVYGEPAGQTVEDSWGAGSMWHRMLAQQGYLVASIDNRGTKAPRGRTWRHSVYRKIGVIASEDQAAAARAMLKWAFVDPTRVGVWGWSGGGTMTLNLMFRYPDLYKTGMAVAPVPEMRLYDSIYQERYMGLPQINAEDYKRGSPITFANQLKGNLLLVHGTGDDNVHYQGTEKLINALIAANKQFSMLAYPNRSHGIYEGPNTTRHLFESLTRFLHQNMPPGPAPVAVTQQAPAVLQK